MPSCHYEGQDYRLILSRGGTRGIRVQKTMLCGLMSPKTQQTWNEANGGLLSAEIT
jgi:hypothetical protein